MSAAGTECFWKHAELSQNIQRHAAQSLNLCLRGWTENEPHRQMERHDKQAAKRIHPENVCRQKHHAAKQEGSDTQRESKEVQQRFEQSEPAAQHLEHERRPAASEQAKSPSLPACALVLFAGGAFRYRGNHLGGGEEFCDDSCPHKIKMELQVFNDGKC